MILSLFIFLFSFPTASVDTAVASAIESMVSSRSRIVHEIEYRSVPRELARLESGVTVSVVDEPRAEYRGSISVPVEVISAAGSRRRFLLGLRIRTFESVAVASALIDRHEELMPASIIMQNIETTQLNGSPLTALSGLARMRTRQIIAAGRVITGSMIEPLPVIAAGAPVTVRVRKENVTLSAAGTAKTDGWKGSTIPVELFAFKQLVKAKVMDAQNVEVIE